MTKTRHRNVCLESEERLSKMATRRKTLVSVIGPVNESEKERMWLCACVSKLGGTLH